MPKIKDIRITADMLNKTAETAKKPDKKSETIRKAVQGLITKRTPDKIR